MENKIVKPFTQLVITTAVATLLFACGETEKSIAKVGDKSITQQQVDAYFEFKRIDTKNTKQADAQLKSYLDREVLSSAIEKTNVLNESLIEAELNEFRKEMLINRYLEKFLKEQVTETAIKNYYASHSDEFESKKVRVAHVLIRTHKNMTEEERKAKYTRAHEAYSKLKSGESFDAVVQAYSEDTVSAKKAGEIGWLNEGAIDPVFSNKVFKELKTDELSEPFQSSFGFHIVKLLEGPAVVKRPFEKVKGNIRHQLRKQAKEAEMKRLMATVTLETK